jgi:CubicO group peptidase (beta-lactamase class C family)
VTAGPAAAAIAEAAFAPVAAALEAGPIPGAVLGVVTAGGDRAIRFAGDAHREPQRRAMAADTWFDLASLTKVIFTTSAILELAAAGRLDLDAPLTTAIPDLRQYDRAAAERRLTFRQCLTHQTHLPAVEPLYTYGLDPPTIRAFVLQRVWRAGPPVYSDINFLLLGIAIERLTRAGLHDTTLPAGLSFRPNAQKCAATEYCTWRGRVLRGEVHDENAFAFKGAGHAGLFGTADGVLDFARALLTGEALDEAGIAAIRTRATPTRTVGWEARHPGWSGGDLCSADTIGHTGFTGTGLWVDFAHGLAWTLLTNRVHPSRHVESGIQGLRRSVGDAVAASRQAFCAPG